MLVSLCLIAAITLSSCTPSEPILPSDTAEKVKEALGYALAPTYLPRGFELERGVGDVSPILTVGAISTAHLLYTKSFPEKVSLALSYPESYGLSDPLMERIGLKIPEDAVSEIRINNELAYLFHGSWSADTLEQVGQAVVPDNPKWEYSHQVSIKFAFAMPNGERTWVRLGTIWPTEEITEKDIVRIAESIVVVE